MSLISPVETHQYTKDKLNFEDINQNPAEQFKTWFKQAQDANISLPEALSLATAELPSGRVSVRIVLMKELDKDGNLVIYSNWEDSRKAQDFKSNPNVGITFWWKELERTVRVEGKAVRMSKAESEPYFQSRPKASQIGATISRQSQPVEDREVIEQKFKAVEEKYANEDVLPCPEFWGGIRVIPERWEFWQGRRSRIHDRIEFSKDGEGWKLQRINP